MRRIWWTFGLTLGGGLISMAASPVTYAEGLNVVVVAGGEAYEGPPRFRLLADGQLIGEADVDNALQPKNGKNALGGRGPSLASVGSSLRKFTFSVPNGDKVSQYSVQFLNDAWGGQGSDLDRNLWVSELIVNGTRYPASKLVGDSKSSQVADGLAVLLMNGSLTLDRPATGWQVATAAPKKARGACKSVEPVLIIGYGIGLSEVPADQVEKITQFASASLEAGCSVTVSGLTTPGGSRQGNERIGKARAEAVKAKLADAGIKRIRTEAKAQNKDRGVLLTARAGK